MHMCALKRGRKRKKEGEKEEGEKWWWRMRKETKRRNRERHRWKWNLERRILRLIERETDWEKGALFAKLKLSNVCQVQCPWCPNVRMWQPCLRVRASWAEAGAEAFISLGRSPEEGVMSARESWKQCAKHCWTVMFSRFTAKMEITWQCQPYTLLVT